MAKHLQKERMAELTAKLEARTKDMIELQALLRDPNSDEFLDVAPDRVGELVWEPDIRCSASPALPMQ